MNSYYDLLGVPPNATEMEIRSAYGRDVLRLQETASDSKVAQFRAALDGAFSTLVDPAKRSAYDAELATALQTNAVAGSDDADEAFRYARRGFTGEMERDDRRDRSASHPGERTRERRREPPRPVGCERQRRHGQGLSAVRERRRCCLKRDRPGTVRVVPHWDVEELPRRGCDHPRLFGPYLVLACKRVRGARQPLGCARRRGQLVLGPIRRAGEEDPLGRTRDYAGSRRSVVGNTGGTSIESSELPLRYFLR